MKIITHTHKKKEEEEDCQEKKEKIKSDHKDINEGAPEDAVTALRAELAQVQSELVSAPNL